MYNITAKSLTFLFFVTLFVVILLVFPIKGNVGVEQGSWATYKILAEEGNATEGKEWIQSRMDETNKIERINATIQEILPNDIVKILEITFFKDGTLDNTSYVSSIRNPGDLGYWIIAGGLKKGDLICDEENLTVRGTYPEEHANVTRWINQGFIEVRRPEINQMQIVEFYWDQATGILCRSLSTYLIVSGDSVTVMVRIMILMIDTNMWKADSSSDGWWLMAIAIVTVFTAALMFIMTKKRKKKHSDCCPKPRFLIEKILNFLTFSIEKCQKVRRNNSCSMPFGMFS